jgi:AraC family transcriptional regulator
MNDFPPHMPYVRRGTIASDAVTPETGRTDYVATADKVESPVKGLVVSQTFVDMSRFIGPVTLATTRVVMVLTGRLVVRHPDGVQTAKPGDVVILRRDVRYHIEPGSISGQTVNIDLTASYMTRCGLEEGNLAQAVYSSPGTNLVVLRLAYGSRHPSDGSLTSSGALITQWMSSSLCNRQMLESRWAKRLRDDMHIHWNETRTLKELGDIAGCHPVTVAKYFPLYFGCTQREYMRRLKAEHAIRYLMGTEHSVTDIAHWCGFSDHSHLTRTLRQLTGTTPAGLRQWKELITL